MMLAWCIRVEFFHELGLRTFVGISIKRESFLISRVIAGRLQGDSRLSLGMDRRKRSKISEAQRLVLEREYAIERLPSREHQGGIAEEIGLSQKTVRVWFQNQRSRNEFVPTSTTLADAMWLVSSDGEDD